MNTLIEAMGEREVCLEKNGEVLCAFTLRLLGYWFPIGDIRYFIPIYALN